MNTLFPLITEYNEEFKEYYTYRQVYFKWNINSEAYRLHKQYTDFPDPSYYWVYPKGEEPKERHVLFGTYYVQHEIWKRQFPPTCENKKFLIVPLWFYGIGSIIHVLTQSLSWAINSDRILITYVKKEGKWGDPEFCDPENQSIMCYLAPLTNCTILDININELLTKDYQHVQSPKYYVSDNIDAINNSTFIYLIRTNPLLSFSIPFFLNDFLELSHIIKSAKWFWRIQAATFITRLNERTVDWIRKYEKENCRDCKNEYDISLYIRHGDKEIEMKMIDANVYKETLKILTNLGMKKNYTIYANADDQESVDIIHTIPYFIVSINRTRHNFGIKELMRESHISLISFTDLYNQIRADHSIGTISSNWNRLIYELKNTVGMKSDGIIFEVNNEKCISYSHCIRKRQMLTVGWR